jgi:hypothetical protein
MMSWCLTLIGMIHLRRLVQTLPNGTSSLITMASFNKVGQTFVTGYDMPVMLLDLNSGGETNRPLYKNDMIITGSAFRNDAALMNIEQTKFSGTWEFL